MDTLKKTYHFVAALTLILFVSTVVLPAGLAAAGLNCNMEMSHVVPVCCNNTDMNNHQEKKKNTQECLQQAFCEQAIDSSPSKIPAVTQSKKIVIAAELLEKLITVERDNNHLPAIKDESASLHYHPPIFLLNSTFLN